MAEPSTDDFAAVLALILVVVLALLLVVLASTHKEKP